MFLCASIHKGCPRDYLKRYFGRKGSNFKKLIQYLIVNLIFLHRCQFLDINLIKKKFKFYNLFSGLSMIVSLLFPYPFPIIPPSFT